MPSIIMRLPPAEVRASSNRASLCHTLVSGAMPHEGQHEGGGRESIEGETERGRSTARRVGRETVGGRGDGRGGQRVVADVDPTLEVVAALLDDREEFG